MFKSVLDFFKSLFGKSKSNATDVITEQKSSMYTNVLDYDTMNQEFKENISPRLVDFMNEWQQRSFLKEVSPEEGTDLPMKFYATLDTGEKVLFEFSYSVKQDISNVTVNGDYNGGELQTK